MKEFQVITLGEAMLRLSPPEKQRLATTPFFEIHIGGAELNTAVALAQLNIAVSWISKLPDHPLGKRIAQEAARFGVDVSHIIWTSQGRIGLFFYELGSSPRSSLIFYDRLNSTINTLDVNEIDWEFIGRANVLHLTGITPALSDPCRKLVSEIIARSKAKGIKVSFDINYRSNLWTIEKARATLVQILPHVDLVICTKEEAQALFNLVTDAETAARQLQTMLNVKNVAVSQAERGAVLATPQGVFSQGGFQISEVDRLGAGDAFSAGLIYGMLHGDWELGLQYAVAMAAIKHTIRGDWFIATKTEVEAILKGKSKGIVR